MGQWKFVRGSMNGPVELYNLATDETETTDLASNRPELVEKFENWVRENRTKPPDQPARSVISYKDYVQLAPVNPAAMGSRNRPQE